MTKKKLFALIDGDGLIHGAKWRNKKDTIEKGWITLGEACKNYDRAVNECIQKTYATEVAIAVKGPNNYRDVLYDDYKKSKSRAQNRDNDVAWIGKLKDYAANRPDTVVCDGYEADDLLRIWACEIRERELTEDVTYVVCTGDKDLDCIWGKHYQFRRTGMEPKLYNVTEEHSQLFFWEQVLTGDKIDNIPGLPGVAHKTAMRLLGAEYEKGAKGKIIVEPTNSVEERERIVVKTYVEKFGLEEGFSNFLMNCKLLYMWKTYGGHFTYKKERFIGLAGA